MNSTILIIELFINIVLISILIYKVYKSRMAIDKLEDKVISCHMTTGDAIQSVLRNLPPKPKPTDNVHLTFTKEPCSIDGTDILIPQLVFTNCENGMQKMLPYHKALEAIALGLFNPHQNDLEEAFKEYLDWALDPIPHKL